MHVKTFFVTLFLLLNTLKVSSNEHVTFDARFQQAYQLLYRFKFQDADRASKRLLTDFPSHPASFIFRANYFWWLIITGEDKPASYKACRDNLDAAVRLLEAKEDSLSEAENYLMVSAYAFKARLKLLEEKRVESLLLMNDCVPYLNRGLGHEGVYPPYYLTSGLYNYLIAHGAAEHPFVVAMLFWLPEGDKAVGEHFLQQAATSETMYISTEAHYFLTKIYHELEEDQERAWTHVTVLCDRFQENLFFQYLRYKVCRRLSDKKEAHAEIRQLIRSGLKENGQLSSRQRAYLLELIAETN